MAIDENIIEGLQDEQDNKQVSYLVKHLLILIEF